MQSNDLFNEIGRVLSENDAVLVLAALRQDPLVWQSLARPDFCQLALERSGSQAGCWSPGQLSLLALDEPRPAELLRAYPMPALGQALQERSLQAYQAAQRSGKAPTTLRDAAQLALALRERRRLTGTWSGLLQELLPKAAKEDPAANTVSLSAAFDLWRTPLACLYSLVPDPEEMLRSLLPRTSARIPFEWIVSVEMSQPVPVDQHILVFGRVLKGLPIAFQLNILRSLSLHGGEAIAAALADDLLVGHPAFASLRVQNSTNALDLTALSSRALALQQMGSFYQLAGDRVQALALFNAAEVTLKQWLSGLFLQRLNLQTGEAAAGKTTLIERDQINHLAEAADWLKDELGVVLVSYPYSASILDVLPEEAAGSFIQLKRAQRLFASDPAVARDLARQGAAEMVTEIHDQGVPFYGDFVSSWQPVDALKILMDLGLLDEALELSAALLTVRPADIQLQHMTGLIYERLGDTDMAIKAALNVAALDPNHVDWHRRLAGLWTQSGQWDQAVNAWEKVLTLIVPPAHADSLGCAQAAFQAGNLDRAIDLSEAVLLEDGANGTALGLLGQALVGKGELHQALNYLVRATLLSPETLAPWLALANVQQAMGEPQRALESLRAAVTAVPDVYESHLALGEAYIAAGLLAEALPHLKKAYLIAPEADRVAYLYGQTLRNLGHAGDAYQVLENARSAWNHAPELAYEYAQVLLDLNDAEGALPVLETALHHGLPVLEGYLLYARILLGEYRTLDENWDVELINVRMQQADQALCHILELDPHNLEARFLMADMLREKGDLDEALVAYRALADSPDSGGEELRWRVQWGLGRTALRLGQVGTALVALKEACQAKPDHLPLQRTLAEASLQADLPKEALEAAAYVLHLASDDVDTLAWYADFVTRAGEPRRAVDALELAVQLSPSLAGLRVNLAVSLLEVGNLAAARASLEAINHLENVSRSDLRRAAHVYLRLEDPQTALACYERALTIEPMPPASLYVEIAQLHNRLGSYDAALELTQQALADTPENLPVHLLQADLLAELDRPQAALAVLEHALRIAQSAEYPLQPAERPAMKQNLGEIHQRFTHLMLQAGDLPAALHHAERALSINPTDVSLCCQAADLALAQLQNERALRIIKSFEMGEEGAPKALLAYGQAGLDLICLKIELALDSGQDEEAAAWIKEIQAQAADRPRVRAVWSRWLARQNDLAAAWQVFEPAFEQAKALPQLWLADAALEVRQWKEALTIVEAYAQAHLNEARAQLALARMLVLCAEQQRLCEALNCIGNAPGKVMLSEVNRQKFEDAIHDALRLVNVGEVGRWQARGEAVFGPSAQTARALASMPAAPEDTAALVAALRHLNNRAAALQVARRHADHPRVLLQLALCALGSPTTDDLETAERAAADHQNQPLANVVLARIAAELGQVTRGLEAYDLALAEWPDEPCWHDAAGDLCVQLGDIQAGLRHRREALALEPTNARLAFKLGQACLLDEDVIGAIDCLERSAALDADQPETWLTLATAYHMAGRLQQALDAADRASDLDPASAQGLLIAGETALSMGQSDQALEFAQGAVRRQPDNADAVLFLSGVLVQRGRLAEGLEVLEEASPAVKAVFSVAFERAQLIRRLHGPEPALEVMEKLVKDYPEESELLSCLALIEAEYGDSKAAERYAFKALRLDPDQPELTLMLGRLQRKTGQLDQAVYLFGEVIRMAPDHLEAHLELGSVYQERREFVLALQTYRQAMQVDPHDYQAFYQSGLILRDGKDYSGAESMLRRAAELAPDNLSIRRQLVGVIALNLVHHKQEAAVQ